MGEPVKGTVTSLSSVFAPEDTQRASVHVQEVISERQKEVQQLQSFLNDNTSLVNLVKKLPDQLHHDIMVPFGKAAFFPGRLIHTNELMVLLGEGYYAERTAKQTVEILKRRGKNLESQIDTVNAFIKDLKFEASFFDETATEAAEGIVEIREEYVDDEALNEDKATTAAGEDDFARILSRMEELEKEELEAEITDEDEEKEEAEITDEDEENEEAEITDEDEDKEEADIESELKESPNIPVSKESHIKVPTPSGSNVPVRHVEHNKVKSILKASTSTSKSSNDSSKTSVVAPVSKKVSFFESNSSNDSSRTRVPAPVSKEVSTIASKSTNDSSKTSVAAPGSKEVSNSGSSSSEYDSCKASFVTLQVYLGSRNIIHLLVMTFCSFAGVYGFYCGTRL
ncbi:uncharacterized protein LOC143617249 isoform X2 [Bidens hawaiensis]|uniref:uncharacterized protein LOC143617249 isoform X2 n=1 Tax=Bidens hawaiensis TaxID=980011 RepID=UPI00404AD34F